MNRLHTKLIRLAVVVSCGVSLLSCGSDYEYSGLYRKLPFDMERVHRPFIPPRTVNIEDFGGVGDGITLNTASFEDAIDVLAQNGGGRLVVPKGIWLTGPMTLKDNIELHLDREAVLLYSAGSDAGDAPAMINAQGARNIAITGTGIIDGNGDLKRPVSKDRVTPAQWRGLLQKSGITNRKGDMWYPDSASYRGAAPNPVVGLRDCEDVLISECTFRNAPSDAVRSSMSRRMIVEGIAVLNPLHAEDCDGIELDSCEEILVINSSFDGVDAAVCVAAGNGADGRIAPASSRNLIADNCNVFHAKYGFVIGGNVAGGVQNVSVSNSRFIGTDAGLAFKSSRGSGGMVENIYAEDLIMMDIPSTPLLIDAYRDGASASESSAYDIDYVPANDLTPHFRNIHISGIVCNSAAKAVCFNGIPEVNIENVILDDCRIAARKGADLRYASGVQLKNVHINQTDSLGYVLANCKNVVMHNCHDADGVKPSVWQHNSENVVIE